MPLPIFAWQSSKPLPSHNFVVFVGVMPIPFSKVSAIEVGIETEALMEGGENRYVHSLSKPVGAEKTLVLERGADSGLAGSVLMTAASTALRVGSIYNQIVICVLDQWGLPKKMYVASHVILKKRRLSDLNAMSGEVFVESMEFVYRTLTEVPGVNVLFSAFKKVI
jgi:phage tail-like protein